MNGTMKIRKNIIFFKNINEIKSDFHEHDNTNIINEMEVYRNYKIIKRLIKYKVYGLKIFIIYKTI